MALLPLQRSEGGREGGGGVAGEREGKRDGGRECLCVMTQ